MSLVIDSNQRSVAQEVIYRRTWSIENFPGLMEFSRHEDFIVPSDLVITVPNEGKAVWRLKCFPKVSVTRYHEKSEDERGGPSIDVSINDICLYKS
jgi:hypothetical protein